MPRQSYREHRAARATAAAYGSDAELESIASYSTLASHTTLASARLSGHFHPGHGHDSFSSFASIPPDGDRRSRDLGPAWTPSSASVPASGPASVGPTPLDPSACGPVPSLRLSPSPSGFSGPPSPSPSPLAPASPTRPRPTSRTLSTSSLPSPTHPRAAALASPARTRTLSATAATNAANAASSSSGREHRDKDEKRRRRERNAERWRRVRAREAAHDAPVRRWAKAAYARFGATGAMATAVLFALALRVMLTLISLSLSSTVRATLVQQVGVARAACSHPPLKTIGPLCAVTYGNPTFHADSSIGLPDTPVSRTASAVLIAAHLALESILGWGAAVAWAVIEGWREGRTVRTRVAAVVYLILAPVLTLSDGALLQMRTAPLGLMAWAILAACSGQDEAAAATIAAAAWSNRAARVYAPAFAVYAVGKRIWLGPKGVGYLARLTVSASMVLTALGSLDAVPLRQRVMDTVGSLRTGLHPAALLTCLRGVLGFISLRGVITLLALIPSAYLMLRASWVLRPAPSEPYTAQSVPATARLLPIMFTAVAAAISLPYADAALPLLPLSLASSLRGDDDEWAVAVQTHHVAAMCLWPKFGALVPLAAGTQLSWAWLIGARRDAPNPVLQAHQVATLVLNIAALVPWYPLLAHIPGGLIAHLPFSPPAALALLAGAHRAFVMVSIGLLAVWTNIRLVKGAWAVGAL